MADRLDTKLQTASSAYSAGYGCAQSVLAAYAEDLGLTPDTARRLMSSFNRGLGGPDGLCGALTAAALILSYLFPDGAPETPEGTSRSPHDSYAVHTLRSMENVFRREYGGITCSEILQGGNTCTSCCNMKVKDTVLMLEQSIGQKRMN